MSNVSLFEIAECCANEFGVEVPALSIKSETKGGRQSPGQRARSCYVWLAQRHTNAAVREIAELIGWRTEAVRELSYKFRDRLELGRDTVIEHHLARIEEAIDRIHERRCSTIDALIRAVNARADA